MRFIRNFGVVVANLLIWLAIFAFWAFLFVGINGTFGAIVLVATPIVLLAAFRTKHQRRHS